MKLLQFNLSVQIFFLYISLICMYVSRVSRNVHKPLSMVTANLGWPDRSKGHLSLLAWYAKHSQWLVGNNRHGTFLPFPPTLFFAPLGSFSHTFQPMLRVAAGLESVSVFALMFMALRGCLWVSLQYLSCYWSAIKHNSFFLIWIHSMVFKLELIDNQQLFANVGFTWSKPSCWSKY